MNRQSISQLRHLCQQMQCRLVENEPMRLHTTFRIGGPAAVFVEPDQPQQIAALADFLAETGGELPWILVGNGSNLLVRDEGFPGVVIHLGSRFSRISVESAPDGGGVLRCQAGAMLAAASRLSAEQGWTGLEFACGIPGSIGGAVYMNAGAYEGEMSSVLYQVTHIIREGDTPRMQTCEAGTLDFSYRHSEYQQNGGWIVEAVFRLQKGDRVQSLARIEKLLQSRREKQPLEFPSAGSTFKRPQGSYASLLIDQCGLKGLRIGDAQVSEKHAGFVVNRGEATCAQVLALMEQVQRRVYEQTGFHLEPEVRIVP